MKNSKFIVVLFLFTIHFNTIFSQSDTNYQVKKTIVVSSQAISYLGFTYEMSQHFFTTTPMSAFHLKQDWKTWRGLDKVFHSYGSYQLSSLFYQMNRWAGFSKKRALNLAFIESTIFSTTKEYCDGRIEVGGWSWYDMGMNFAGNSLFYLQEKFLDKQLFQMKYSYNNSGLQHYNPNVLGASWKTFWLRDYNGQTFWISTSLGNMNLTTNKWLKPLAICFGYGGNNLIWEFSNKQINLERYSQFYLGLDIDLTQIKSKYQLINTALFLFNRLRIPLPCIEYNSLGQFSFHPFRIK
jgi:uncharacterized protein YfiM (DUF2279 family)